MAERKALFEFLRLVVIWPLVFATPWIGLMVLCGLLWPEQATLIDAASFLGGMVFGAAGSMFGISRMR